MTDETHSQNEVPETDAITRANAWVAAKTALLTEAGFSQEEVAEMFAPFAEEFAIRAKDIPEQANAIVTLLEKTDQSAADLGEEMVAARDKRLTYPCSDCLGDGYHRTAVDDREVCQTCGGSGEKDTYPDNIEGLCTLNPGDPVAQKSSEFPGKTFLGFPVIDWDFSAPVGYPLEISFGVSMSEVSMSEVSTDNKALGRKTEPLHMDTTFAFPDTGDPEKNQQIAENFITHERRLAEQMCPNGDGPLVATEDGGQTCERCGFTQHKFIIGVDWAQPAYGIQPEGE